MKKRRSLIEGIKDKEEEFVYGAKQKNPQKAVTPKKSKPRRKPEIENEVVPRAAPIPEAIPPEAIISNRPLARVPLTTRIRSDLADALKRASLERQLARQEPHTVQEILEEALEPWLKEHAYLKQ